MSLIGWSLLLLSLFWLAGCSKGDAGTAKGAKYHCPMHPTYVSDRMGDCPICNMKLVLIKEDAKPAAASASGGTKYICTMCPTVVSNQPGLCPECNMKLVATNLAPASASGSATDAKPVKYHCPMHPTYVSDRMGDCPICNMKLVPIKDGAGPEASAVPGRVLVALSPEKRNLIGLATTKVDMRDLSQTIRATAVVQHDETRFTRIAPRFNGWVQELMVNYTGQHVHKGDPLFKVFSPDLMASENEYLLAYRNYQETAQAATVQREAARRLMDSARKRLHIWQIDDEEIRGIETRQEVKDEMIFRAPFSGHVTVKNAVEGKAFTAGETLYEIADLSRVWLRVAVFEYDWPNIKLEQKARVIFPYLGEKTFTSSVTFLYPHVDPQTRRGEVRLELDNPNHELRPDMWATVELEVPLGRVLAVPASAIIDTGTRQLAFVDREDQHLEPREVKIGGRTDDYWQVLDGLKDGEKVVTRALFLVDSESQLKAAIAAMTAEPAPKAEEAKPAPAHQH
ncbi:MAG: efflux RND transporter periplasmic adaptor subunit [Verrucomicrobiota bacterium]